jgi:hypothetical protein
MKKCINKKSSSAILALLVLLFAVGIFWSFFSDSEGFFLEKYANADAKFYNEHIITSVNEGVFMLDFEGEVVKSYEGLKASWMYAYPEEGLIVYSNHDNETHLLKLDENMEMISDEVILATDLLAIDPTICKAGDTYLVTHTTIEGTINNPDPNGDNGIYSLELYASKDLKNWEHRTTITSQKQDIEDIDMLYDENTLYCIYEKENYDKGPSKICMRYSEDAGKSWSEEKILIDNGGDNEFSCVLPEYDGWRLYYSSDKENPGASYNGASAYSAFFDADFMHIEELDEKVDMKDNLSVRLYEVKQTDAQLYLMYAKDYMTDKDFVLRSITLK